MARSKYGNSTSYIGRIGNVVSYEWRGKVCQRSLPSHYNDAHSEAQLSQRSIFKLVVGFAARARQILKLGLHKASMNAQLTEYNYFMRINKECFAVVDNALEVDYENLVLSEGPVAPVAFKVTHLLDDTTVSVDFEKNPLHRVAGPNDCVYLVAYCPELGDFDISSPAFRRHNSVTMSLNPYWAGCGVHLWGFVVDSAGRASMSQYIGSGVLSMELAEDWEGEGVENDSIMLDNTIADIQSGEKQDCKTVSKNEPSERRSDVASPAPPE